MPGSLQQPDPASRDARPSSAEFARALRVGRCCTTSFIVVYTAAHILLKATLGGHCPTGEGVALIEPAFLWFWLFR